MKKIQVGRPSASGENAVFLTPTKFLEKKSFSSLETKINRAVKLLKSFAGDDVVELSYSGGKDSEVILELAKMAGIKFRAIYKNTTIDPPGTILHCQRKGAEILQPKKTFFQLLQEAGAPTMRVRFCCQFLKEYKVLDKAIQGIRACESVKRKARYDVREPIICRMYRSKKNRVQLCLPIVDWSDEDVKNFVELRKIKCHPLYYDKNGNFDVKKRLGCIACPLQYDKGVKDFEKMPKFFQLYVKNLKKWWETHPNINSKKKFRDIYSLIAHNLFFKTYSDFYNADKSIFGIPNWKQKLEERFNVNLP